MDASLFTWDPHSKLAVTARIAALSVIVLLAGCLSDGTSAAVSSSSAAVAPEPTADAETGSILGLVTDDEITPIGGAIVYSITDAKVLVTSDANGRFTLNDLAPARLELQFQAVGYHSATRTFQVIAGEILEASIVLQRIPTKVGYAETWQHAGQFNASVGTPALSPRVGQFTFSRAIQEDLRSTVTSADWDAGAPGTANRMRLLVNLWGKQQLEKIGPKPLVARIDSFNVSDPTRSQLQHDILVPTTCDALSPTTCVPVAPFIVDPWIAQRFTLYVTAFYWEPAPAEFSNLPPS